MSTTKKTAKRKAPAKRKRRGDGGPIIVGGGGGNRRGRADEYGYVKFQPQDYPLSAPPDQPGKLYFIGPNNEPMTVLTLKIGTATPIDLLPFLDRPGSLEVHLRGFRERIRITSDPLGVEFHPADFPPGGTLHEKKGTTITTVQFNQEGSKKETILVRLKKDDEWIITALRPVGRRSSKRRAKR